jgi:hypothetical protein
MPSLTLLERQAHQQPIDLSTAALTPIDAANRNEVRPTSLRIEMKGDRPVYSFGRTAIYADTGELVPILGADRQQAVEIIRRWVPEHAVTVRYDKYLEDSDQWTLQSAQRNQMPRARPRTRDALKKQTSEVGCARSGTRAYIEDDRSSRSFMKKMALIALCAIVTSGMFAAAQEPAVDSSSEYLLWPQIGPARCKGNLMTRLDAGSGLSRACPAKMNSC